jgi:hypothetical protein
MFQGNVMSSSSKAHMSEKKDIVTFEDDDMTSPQTSGSDYPATQGHIWEEWNP